KRPDISNSNFRPINNLLSSKPLHILTRQEVSLKPIPRNYEQYTTALVAELVFRFLSCGYSLRYLPVPPVIMGVLCAFFEKDRYRHPYLAPIRGILGGMVALALLLISYRLTAHITDSIEDIAYRFTFELEYLVFAILYGPVCGFCIGTALTWRTKSVADAEEAAQPERPSVNCDT
ncbi:MAG: hypothetical protein AB1696_19675, partial [Planctomycetota bacterium]